MEYSQPWTYPFPEVIYNPASSGNISSYFVRPNKVVKPNSRNNSPRALGRRKTTTSATISSRTQSVVDHLRSHTHQWPASNGPRSRPVSWHPNTIDNAPNLPFSPNTSAQTQDFSSYNFATAHVNGLITPISYPVANEPQIQELITPLDECPGQSSVYPYDNQSLEEQAWLGHHQQKFEPYCMNLFCQQLDPMQPSLQFNPQHTIPLQTAPSSPDCLPLQVDTLSLDTTHLNTNDESEELVGMGLYDSPADVQSTSLLFGSASTAMRKSLKLEESFEPEEGEDEDNEDGCEEEEAEEDDCTLHVPANSEYSSQSIANHMGFQIQQQPDPIASKYLATLGQLNSVYYPTSHASHGWI